MPPKDTRLVYSTDSREGKCLTCGKMKFDCKCKVDRPSKAVTEQDIRVSREKQGRGGKAVTVCKNFALSAADLEKLAKEMKSGLACGGTVAEGTIELQGDQRDRAVAFLQKKGYKVKKSGG
jgi:translation initiation factor 1